MFKNINFLEGILQSKAFKPSYAKESITIKNEILPTYFIPMVCFSDFRLSELGLHVEKYGSYGIGMSKEWGVKNGLNPVIYINDKCKVFHDIRQSLIAISQSGNNGFSQGMMSIYCYIKNHRGKLYRKGEIIEDFIFSDDKEWRYIPNKIVADLIVVEELQQSITGAVSTPDRLIGDRIIRNKSGLENKINKEDYLLFDYDDIKFILVPDVTARNHLIFIIENIFDESSICFPAPIPTYKIASLAKKEGCCGVLNEHYKIQNSTKKQYKRIRDSLISKIMVVEHLDF